MTETGGEKKREGETTKPIDVTLMTNDLLRPWTIDRSLEEQVKLQITELEKTKSIISPQKKAGARGNSILDEPIPEFIQHKHTVLMQTKMLKTKFDHPVFTGPTKLHPSPSKTTLLEPLTTTHFEPNITTFSPKAMSPIQDPVTMSFVDSMDLHSHNTESGPPQAEADSYYAADFKYIDRLQRQLQHETKRHEQQLQERPNTVNTVNYKRAINSAIYSIRKGEFDSFTATQSRPSLSPEKRRLLIQPPKPDHPTLFNIDTSSLAMTHSSSLKALEGITSPTKKLIIMKRALSPIKTSHGDLMLSPALTITSLEMKRHPSPSKLSSKASPAKKAIDWGSSSLLSPSHSVADSSAHQSTA